MPHIFNMTNSSKDTITVHCIVERISDALSALMLRQSATEQSQNEETMELDSSLNKRSSLSNNNNQTSTHLLSDLLQQSSYSQKETLDKESKDEFNQTDFNQDELKCINDEFKEQTNKDEFEFKQLDDRPNSKSDDERKSPKSMDQFDNSAIKESNKLNTFSSTNLINNKTNPLSLVTDLLRSKGQLNNYKVEDDFYAELPANTSLQELVKCALTKQGYSVEDCSAAKGFIELRNWKPLTLEQISDDSETTISDILGDISSIVTLRVRLSTTKSKSNSDFKDKLLQFLLTHCYGTLTSNPAFSSNPEHITSFNSKLVDLINESNSGIKTSFKELENNDDDEKIEPFYLQQLLSTIGQQQSIQQEVQQNNQQFNNGGRRSVNSNSSNSSLLNCNSNNNSTITNLELDTITNNKHTNKNSPTIGFTKSSFNSNSRQSPNQQQSFSLNGNSLLNSQNSILNSQNNSNNLNHHQQQSQTNSSFPNRTRIRTSFDPEHELPKLHRWFAEDQHPNRQKIQEYVQILNNLESRRGRKPLDVNNVVYWFKNARAAAKRNPGGCARLSSGQSPQQLQQHQQQQLNGSNVNSLLNDQLNPNDLMIAHQRQLMNQLQLLNQHQNPNFADLLSSGAGKNVLKNLMLKNAGLINDDLLNCDQQDDEDDQQMLNDYNQQQSKEQSDDENEQNEDTFSNFAQTLDLSIKQQQQSAQNSQNNIKRRKVDTSSTFDECEEQDDKDSVGSASPINQLSSLNKRTNQLNSNNEKQRFALNKQQLNTLKSLSQGLNQSNQRHMLLDQVNQDKDDNQQQLVNSDGELDDENQESDGELDEKNYYASMLNANRNNANISQLAANFMNTNYLQQTVSDLFMNRLIGGQSNNVANALANNSLGLSLSSAAGLIAAGGLNTSNSHPLSALTANTNAFGQNNLLSSLNNNPNSPDDGIRRIRRSRTFIDPITEVPRLEQWFSQNTHPQHTQIVSYTDDLNKLPYRQKFPKLEPKNVQFWFKNRRAKTRRVGLSNPTSQTGQTNSSTASLATSQSNSQSDSPTPPTNDNLMCMNGNREYVSRLVH